MKIPIGQDENICYLIENKLFTEKAAQLTSSPSIFDHLALVTSLGLSPWILLGLALGQPPRMSPGITTQYKKGIS